MADIYKLQVEAAMKMANKLADLAEAMAETFENIPGDVALRALADAARKSNALMADFDPRQ